MPTIVFVHGLLGFATRRVLGVRINGFRGVAQACAGRGAALVFPTLPPQGSVVERAAALARAVSRIADKKIHLVAHSMGGLDARHFLHALDPARHVTSLTTLATPHGGTPLADWVQRGSGAIPFFGRGLAGAALADLTQTGCRDFNHNTPNRSDVRYFSYAAARPVAEMLPWFRPWARRIEAEAGPNDSQVPVSSAQWGEFRGVLSADHLEVIGWNVGPWDKAHQRPFDHIAFYQGLIRDLLAL